MDGRRTNRGLEYVTKIWDKQDWVLRFDKDRKEYTLFYRNQPKLCFTDQFIWLYEIKFNVKDDCIELNSMGQSILRVMK
jgi:hypothetical protein